LSAEGKGALVRYNAIDGGAFVDMEEEGIINAAAY